MPSRKRAPGARFRVGRVSVYPHQGAWWVYYRDGGKPVRRKVADNKADAEQVAARVNAQLSEGAPTLLAFSPIGVSELRRQFLDSHDHVLNSTVSTVSRYRAATQHLEDFVRTLPKPPQAHEVRPEAFAAYLRSVEVTPNGHPNARWGRLRDKGVQFVLETVRAMYTFAGRRRHLPPYAGNPSADLPIDKLKVEDAKPIFVFTADTEAKLLAAADDWALPIHFTLAKTGLRVGELTHMLIDEVALTGGWLHVRNKPPLGWRVKTGTERAVPLLPEVVAVLRAVIGTRAAGPVFLRPRFRGGVAPCNPSWVERVVEILASGLAGRQSGRALVRFTAPTGGRPPVRCWANRRPPVCRGVGTVASAPRSTRNWPPPIPPGPAPVWG